MEGEQVAEQDEAEASFDAYAATGKHEDNVRSMVAKVMLAICKLQREVEDVDSDDHYAEAFRELRNAALRIDAHLKISLHSVWVEYDREVTEKVRAISENEKLTALVTQMQADIARLKAEEDARWREHNPSSPEVRARVLAMTEGRCAYCGCEVTPGKDDGKPEFVVEHVVPKSAGGPDHICNYVPACSICNTQKATGHVIEFIRKRAVGA